MAEDFTLIAKIKADTSDLMKEINSLPAKVENLTAKIGKNIKIPGIDLKGFTLPGVKGMKMPGIEGLKLPGIGKGPDIGKGLLAGNAKMIAMLGKVTIVLGVIAVLAGLIVASSGKLQAALGRLYKVFLLFFKPIGDLLSRGVNAVAKELRDIQKEIAPGVEVGAGLGTEKAGNLADFLGIEGVGKALLESIIGAFAAAGWTILGLLGLDPSKWQAFITDLGTGWSNFIAGLQTAWDGFVTYITGGQFVTDLQASWTAFSTWLGELWDGLQTTWEEKITPIVEWFRTNIISPLEERWAEWSTWFGDLWTELDTSIKGIIEPIVKWFNDTIVTPLINAWTSFKDAAIKAWTDLKDYITNNPIIQVIKQVVTGAAQGVSGTISAAQKYLGGAQVGIGYVAKDDVYRLHRGEKVVSATGKVGGSISFSPSITVNVIGGGTTKTDAELVYREIMTRMERDFRRLY